MSNAQELDIQIGTAQCAISKAHTLTGFFGEMLEWDKEDLSMEDLTYIRFRHNHIADTVSMILDYLDQADKALKADIIEKAIKTLYGEPAVIPETR